MLAAGGQLAFNAWDRLETCPVAAEADAAIRACFPTNPPTFYETPFGLHDSEALRRTIASAGFDNVTIDRVALEGARLAPADAACGIIRGGAFAAEILQRGGDVGQVESFVAERLAARFGSDPFPSPMRAIVYTAIAV